MWFISDDGHELKTPVAVIRANRELLAKYVNGVVLSGTK